MLAEAVERVSTAFDESEGDLGAVLDQVGDLEEIRDAQIAAERVAEFAAAECDLPVPGS